jgi:hypothetical protein
MRLIGLSALSLVLLAACGEQQPVVEAPVAPAEAPAAITEADEAAMRAMDANNMTSEEITAKLVGAFKSTQDDRSTLTITSDGKWTEVYDDMDPVVSTWRVFAGTDAPDGTNVTFTPASRYLEVTSTEGAVYYEMGGVSDAGFDMFYTARGNNLSFARVDSPG